MNFRMFKQKMKLWANTYRLMNNKWMWRHTFCAGILILGGFCVNLNYSARVYLLQIVLWSSFHWRFWNFLICSTDCHFSLLRFRWADSVVFLRVSTATIIKFVEFSQELHNFFGCGWWLTTENTFKLSNVFSLIVLVHIGIFVPVDATFDRWRLIHSLHQWRHFQKRLITIYY